MEIALKIPVKNFVKKYIVAKYGTPWVLSDRYSEGRTFKQLLDRAPLKYQIHPKSETVLEVVIPARFHYKYGSYITPENCEEFNAFIHDKIIDEVKSCYHSIQAGIGLKRNKKIRIMLGSKERRISPDQAPKFFTRKEVIYDILDKYGISDADLTFDSITKQLQRSRMHRE